MPDREKVIAELQEYHDREWTDERMDGLRERNIRKRVTGNALALLQEQENASKRNPVIVCPHCGKRVK
jgi:hypothetical protein